MRNNLFELWHFCGYLTTFTTIEASTTKDKSKCNNAQSRMKKKKIHALRDCGPGLYYWGWCCGISQSNLEWGF